MAPADKPYIPNPAADIYSLGVIMFMIIYGHHPYLSSGSLSLNLKQFIMELMTTPLQLNNYIRRNSLEFDKLLMIVIEMLDRKEK